MNQPDELAVRFLGVGNASAPELGNSCIVLERHDAPLLQVDCGPIALQTALNQYHKPPENLFITHMHFDHIGGMESLFFALRFATPVRPLTRLFVPAPLVPYLQKRVAEYPGVIAEGGSNFWDVFQLIPVSDGFWLDGLWFRVFPVRHHMPDTAFGIVLPGVFLYSGDTRPIPEQISAQARHNEVIFHDCVAEGNPSHTGLDDLLREYPEHLRERMVLYHYHGTHDEMAFSAADMRWAKLGQVFEVKGKPILPTPDETV